MRFLTQEDSFEWCKHHAFKVTVSSNGLYETRDLESVSSHSIRFSPPSDSGKKVALARAIVEQWELKSGMLLWVQNWGVWPSSGHLPLMGLVRTALGEKRSLHLTPGHLAGLEDKDAAVSILVVSLEFFWDCLVCTAEDGNAFFTSHDEYCVISCRSVSDIKKAENLLRSVCS
ncbi:MAG: hypothetical protein WCO56_26735 [Verrucomicrobiota bacterium]